MNYIIKALGVFMLGALGAGVVIYANENCPEKKENNEKNIISIVQKYVNENPDFVGEYIKNNANDIANIVLSSETFKNANISNQAEEVSKEEEEGEAEVNPNQQYIDNWNKLSNNPVAPFVGPKDAEVTVVEFFDFNCGHCKALAPIISQLIKNNPDVKFVFNPLYFMSEHSPYAAKVSLAAFKKGKFEQVFEGIMTLPQMNEETINQILVDEGLDVKEIKKMIEEKEIRRGVQDIDALSQVLGINGVPLIIINGEAFYGRTINELQNKINSYK